MDINAHLVDSFIYRCINFDLDEGYKRFIEDGSLPKSKLVYVYLYDPEDKIKIIKEGYIIRSRWKRYRKRNITVEYKDKIYKLSDFTPLTDYVSSLHYNDYNRSL